jgi:hypothetical protein
MKIRIYNFRINLRSILLTLLFTVVTANIALGELLGNPRNLNPILADLIDPLHEQGIDVVAGKTSTVKLSERARVAMLASMPLRRPPDFQFSPWMADFESGSVGVVVGVKTDGPGSQASDSATFRAVWSEADRDKRIFLSFTASDVEAAHAVANTLQKRGYIIFLFMNRSDQKPQFTAQTTGRFFSEAGHYLVLDSNSARRSHGVWLEASIARKFTGPDGDGAFPSPTGGPEPTGPTNPTVGEIESDLRADVAPGFDKDEFIAGVRGSWIVTENPSLPDKLFVHRSASGGTLTGLLYRVQVERDGSWTVYEPSSYASAGSLGTRQGWIRRPSGVSIGSCTCR